MIKSRFEFSPGEIRWGKERIKAMTKRKRVQVRRRMLTRVDTWDTADDYATDSVPFFKTQIIQGLAPAGECFAVMRSGIIIPCKAGDWRFA